MTSDEFKKVRRHLFIAFPDLLEWLRTNSPDIEATLELWFRIVKDCGFHECLHVIDDWTTGKRPAPKAFERSQTALMLRQSVEFDRAQERERNHELSERERVELMRSEYVKARDRDYKPLPMLGQIFREGQQLRRDLLDGKITQEEHDRRKQELIDSVQ